MVTVSVSSIVQAKLWKKLALVSILKSPGNFLHLQGIIIEGEAWGCVSVLRKYLRSCLTFTASKQNDTLCRRPGAVEASPLAGQTVSLLPRAAAGEGVAGKPGRRVVAATAGDPILRVVTSN